MGFFSNLFRQDISVEQMALIRRELEDVKLALSRSQSRQSQIEAAIKQKRKTLQKPLGYASPAGSGVMRGGGIGVLHGPQYDLGEIARAIDIEPYVNQSVRKHREQILKEGYFISGEDEEMVEYINKRIFEMYMVSDVTFDEVIRDFTTNLIAYATSFLTLSRVSDNRSSGTMIMVHGKRLDPIAAVYPMDPTSVVVEVNKHGHPIKWTQKIPSSISGKNEITFDASDIVMATIDKKPGFIFGTPYILPTLDDVRSLRRLEELAEVVAHKYAHPEVHWKVGTKDDPPEIGEDGSTEIAVVRNEIENMTNTGGLVTSYRVEHEMIGQGKAVLDLEPYLQ